jgi:hypothetical protein
VGASTHLAGYGPRPQACRLRQGRRSGTLLYCPRLGPRRPHRFHSQGIGLPGVRLPNRRVLRKGNTATQQLIKCTGQELAGADVAQVVAIERAVRVELRQLAHRPVAVALPQHFGRVDRTAWSRPGSP